MADTRKELLKNANKFFRQGKMYEAISEYEKIISLDPENLDIRRIVGDLHLRQDNILAALKQFEWITDYYRKEGFFAKAVEMFKRINRIDPNYKITLFNPADLHPK